MVDHQIIEEKAAKVPLNPLVDDMPHYDNLTELANKVVDPLHETAVFDESKENEELQFSKDSGYFTRNQMVLDKATYGGQANINGKNILAEKLKEQFGEEVPKQDEGDQMSFAPESEKDNRILMESE